MKKIFRMTLAVAVMLVTMLAVCSFSSSAADTGKWIGAWGTAPTQIGIDGFENIDAYIGNVTVRSVITPTASGTQMRVRLSNKYGKKPLTINHVTVAKSLGGSVIDTETLKTALFNNDTRVVIPAGGEVVSDPISYKVTAQEDISISIFAADFQSIRTMGLSGATSYITKDDAVREPDFNLIKDFVDDQEMIIDIIGGLLGTNFELGLEYSFIRVVPVLANVDVLSNSSAYTVAVVGDSTIANEFPLYLSQNIYEEGLSNVGVVGKGIIGNKLLDDGLGYGSLIFGDAMLERFSRDVLEQPNVKYVIVKIGANDIMHPVCKDNLESENPVKQPTAKEIIEGYRKIFEICHDADIKVIAASITQWKGTKRDYFGTGAQYDRTLEEFEADWKIALEVNEWLATTKEHDGYVDFAEISADPLDSAAFLPEYTVDGIHPSDSLQRKWAEYFPKSLIGVGKHPAGVILNKKTLSLKKDKSYTLEAEVQPSTVDAENKKVIWHSENPEVAVVDQNGKVTARGNGKATIICETLYGSGEPIYSGNEIYFGYIAKCVVTVTTPPKSVSLDKTTDSVYVTKSTKLKATVLPADTSNKGVTWKSSNTNIATVSSSGTVYGKGSGTVTITATSKANSKLTASCKVTVKPKKEVTDLTISKSKLSIYRGRSYSFDSVISPSNATFKDVKWTSSNSKVVSVDSEGNIKALKAGTAVITCKSVDNPMVFAKCTVTVNVKVTGVEISRSTKSIYDTTSYTLKATVLPKDATNKNIKWTSSNPKVATVDKNGKVTAVKPGTAVITVKTENSGYIAKCTVTVLKIVRSTGVKLNKTAISIKNGHSYDLVPTISPSNVTLKNVTWKSSDTKVAKVSSSGVVTGIKPGTAVITCTTKDTGKKTTCKVTVKAVTPSRVYFSQSTVNVGLGRTLQLNAVILPTNATNKSVKWTSSDPSVVSVSKTGVVKGLKAGKSAVITATTVSGKKTATITVKVNPIKVKGVKLNKTAITLNKGAYTTLKATISPASATNKGVTWKSSNTKVATVNSKGKVTAMGKGSATITCTTKDGKFIASCKVTVKLVPVVGITIDKTQLLMSVGKSTTLKAQVVPENASNKAIKWESSDTSVAKVSSKGVVTAVGKGTCQIKAISVDGNSIISCKVVVI